MKKILFIALAITPLLTGTVVAQAIPNYYSIPDIKQAEQIDAVYLDERRIVIGDVSYQLSDSVVVHSLSAYSDSLSRLRVGANVAIKMNSNRLIEQIWLLPGNYDPGKQR